MRDASDTSAQAASPLGPEPLVRVRGLSKRFGGTVALAGVDLDVHAGSVLALLGPNGAGKSTLIKILAGVHHADAGQITVAGQPLGGHTASRSMSFIHQDLGLVDWMTVAENIALTTGYARRGGLISWRRTRERCVAALRIVAAHLDPDAPVSHLAPADRSLVAIARALAARARLIVLDEPTARLPAADSARLFRVLHDLRDRGHAILYVTHRLDEVYQVADAFAVLRDGRLVSHGRLAGHSPARLVHDIVGEEAAPDAHRPARAPADAPVVLTLDGVRTARAGPVGLELTAGEVLGLVGLSDAGHTDLGRALAGARPLLGGRAVLHGRPYHPRTVAEAVARGVGFVPGDRLREGCLAELTVRENLMANPRAGGRPAPRWIGPRRERAQAAALLDRFAVRPRDSETPIATLSGGNQQKVMIGRWLRTDLRLLILEEPTAGVDVGAKAAVHRLLQEALEAGLAVLLLSTDFEEVASVCRRTLVFVRGAVTAELRGPALTVAGLTRAASALPPSTAARP
ncbi:sugar ABC transporter ATP-binding protein [Streptomyces lomondensis]|uniref:Sugar ABC transporter ATP-binding protein n=1 Tax=Streptomyces lomondensis TaxID=68229 RepID=A0ABQ2X688_9ACTN|nr:sugar ABC transporter ATP-binding protein [Streptomyces lomondensis]MCF0078132.1 sugar ABC transporter ATP-binding protein [Streptomyces lomondensis]GGX00609.1 sugar ABC transporter ATP-binding protein [Streptomyces lomondensis]